MKRTPAVLAGLLALVLLAGLAVVGTQVVQDLHRTRVRLDQQQRGVGAMPELQRTQIELARQQLATAREQLALTQRLLTSSEHVERTADATLAEARRTRALVTLMTQLARQIAVLVARIDRKQYQPPLAPSSPSR